MCGLTGWQLELLREQLTPGSYISCQLLRKSVVWSGKLTKNPQVDRASIARLDMRPGEQAGGEMIVVGGREDAMVELTLRFHTAMSAVSVAHQRGDAGFGQAVESRTR